MWIDGKVLIPVSKTPEFIICITEFDWYIWRGRKPGGMCLLFSLFDDKKIPVYSSEKKPAQHVYEWTCLPKIILAPGFLALKNQWVGFSISGKSEKRYYLKVQTNLVLLSTKVVQIMCSSKEALFRSKANAKIALNEQWMSHEGTKNDHFDKKIMLVWTKP